MEPRIIKAEVKRRRKSLETIAYHEAGHAVMGFITRRRVSVVSIIPRDISLGHVRFAKVGEKFLTEVETHSEFDLRTRARVEGFIMVCYAGPAAESILRGRNVYRGREHDFEAAAAWLTHICGSDEKEQRAYSEWLWHRTRRLLGRPFRWAGVRALAGELLRHRRVEGRAAREIVWKATQEWMKRERGQRQERQRQAHPPRGPGDSPTSGRE